jgi:ribose 5-phosphate isomerase B
MKIIIGNDHRGVTLKKEILSYLENKGYITCNVGTDNEESVDYPIYAKKLAQKLDNGDLGILICGTGIGMSIAANKIKGIRCAKVNDKEEAYLTRLDNDANVISLSSKLSFKEAVSIVDTFISTKPSLEERHIRRRKMLEDLENDN